MLIDRAFRYCGGRRELVLLRIACPG
jgi:hypothetical protein